MAHRRPLSSNHRLALYAAIAALCGTAGAPAQATQVLPDGDMPATNVSGVDVPTTIQAADWIYMPRPFQIFAFLPHRIQRRGIMGNVVLKCRVLPTAAVSDCSVLSDTNPEGILGDAALKSSTLFKIKPRTVNGTLSENAWVRIPMSFNLGKMK
jgi:TonB family protein